MDKDIKRIVLDALICKSSRLETLEKLLTDDNFKVYYTVTASGNGNQIAIFNDETVRQSLIEVTKKKIIQDNEIIRKHPELVAELNINFSDSRVSSTDIGYLFLD